MEKMFLASSFGSVSHLLADFIGSPLKGKRLTFIPTASGVEAGADYVDEAVISFKELGIEVEVLEVEERSTAEAEEMIQRNDLIYVGGGNTFYLLQELKRKGLDKILVREIKAGKIYLGESAGSVIMSPNIEYIQWMDEKIKAPDLTDYTGLNLVADYPLPHYQSSYLNEIAEETIIQMGNEIALIPFTDDQVIIVAGAEVKLI